MSLTLRDYQSRAIHDLRLAYRLGARAPLLVAATGCGKTVIFSAITAGAVERGRRVLILVHRRELIRQASAKLTHAGVTHGIIAAGFEPSDQAVQVASVQTLARRLKLQTWQPDLIVVDEAHHAVAGTWSQILDHWPHALRLGVTATPVRRDGRGLGSMFDRLVLGPSVQDLTAQGFLTSAKIYLPASPVQLGKLRVRSGDYAPEEAAAALDKPTITGDVIEHFQRLGRGCSAIAFCCTTAHAEHVARQFCDSGITSQVLLGTTAVEQREQALHDLATGALQVLVSVDVISEGTDVPSVGAAILLRPTQSEGLYLQQVGRVLRPAPGKTHALILDHVGNVHRHGFPDDHREWSLDDARRRTRNGGPPAPAVRTCEVCFAAFKPQPICPVCGAECTPDPRRALKQVDGELQELKRVNAQLRQEERRKQGRARTIGQLLAIAHQRGYSPEWAYRVHNARNRGAAR
jgi:DNA repair protein RadD